MRDGTPNSRRQTSASAATPERIVSGDGLSKAQAHPALVGGPFLDAFSPAKRHIRHAGRLHREGIILGRRRAD
jgi:hypothetical protein